jgi:hypothetical protein
MHIIGVENTVEIYSDLFKYFHVSDQSITTHFQPISYSDPQAVGFHSVLTTFSSELRFAVSVDPRILGLAKRRSVFRLLSELNFQ